jgi:hypothetical protein
MALACPYDDHPVGDGTFCRICGRDYVVVPEQAVAQLVTVGAPAVVPALTEPPLPPPVQAELPPPPAPPATEPLPLPRQQGGVVEVADAFGAPEEPAQDDEPKASRFGLDARLSPAVLAAVAGFGGGAVLMALLDRLVL